VGGWVDLTRGAGGTTLILSIPLTPHGMDIGSPPELRHDDDPSQWGAL
jgi:hypothetical protein